MEQQMFASLQTIKNKHQALSEKLNDPKIAGDIKQFTKITKELNAIAAIVSAFADYEKLQLAITDAHDIIKLEKDHDLIALAKQEMEIAEKAMPALEEKIKLLLVPRDKNDDKDVIVEIRGAAGGNEANIFAGDLFAIYKKWGTIANVKINLIGTTKSEGGGFSQITFKASGDHVYSKLKYETGSHRVQRVPTTETQGRLHTSTATVTVLPEPGEDSEIVINPSDLKIDTFRSSGAGGQSVNTTDSAVRITHLPTKLVVSSQNERSQLQNREICLRLLRVKLYDLEIQKQNEADASFRALAGSGQRAEKIRTYNYPQDRVTDHRVSLSVSLKSVLDGKLDNIIETLQAAERAARLKATNH